MKGGRKNLKACSYARGEWLRFRWKEVGWCVGGGALGKGQGFKT